MHVRKFDKIYCECVELLAVASQSKSLYHSIVSIGNVNKSDIKQTLDYLKNIMRKIRLRYVGFYVFELKLKPYRDVPYFFHVHILTTQHIAPFTYRDLKINLWSKVVEYTDLSKTIGYVTKNLSPFACEGLPWSVLGIKSYGYFGADLLQAKTRHTLIFENKRKPLYKALSYLCKRFVDSCNGDFIRYETMILLKRLCETAVNLQSYYIADNLFIDDDLVVQGLYAFYINLGHRYNRQIKMLRKLNGCTCGRLINLKLYQND